MRTFCGAILLTALAPAASAWAQAPTIERAVKAQADKDVRVGIYFRHLRTCRRIGSRQQWGRYLRPNRLRSLEIDDQLEFGGLLDRQIARLFAFENAIRRTKRRADPISRYAYSTSACSSFSATSGAVRW